MKKRKNLFVIFSVFAAIFLIGIPSSFDDSFGTGVTCVLFAALFGFLSYRNYLKIRKITKLPPAPMNPPTQTVLNVPREQSYRRSHQPDSIITPEQLAAELDQIPQVPFFVSAPAEKPSFSKPEIRYSSINKRTNVNNLFPLIVLDTETTGLSPTNDEIIEVSAIKYEKGFVPVACFSTLTKPSRPIPAAASAVNHIYDNMVSDKPTFPEIAASFSEFISGCNIVGHNLPFDLDFLHNGGVNFSDKVRFFDTLDISRHTLVKKGQKIWNTEAGHYEKAIYYDVDNHKLDTLCEYYGVFRPAAHRSANDCHATAKIFEKLIEARMNKE